MFRGCWNIFPKVYCWMLEYFTLGYCWMPEYFDPGILLGAGIFHPRGTKNPPHRPYSQDNPSHVIFRSLPVLKIPRGSRNSQSCDGDFGHVDTVKRLYTHFNPALKHPRTPVDRVLGTKAICSKRMRRLVSVKSRLYVR